MVPGANVLKAARIALGLSPDELAERAGISRRTLGRVETHPRSDRYLKGAAMVQKALEDQGVEFLKALATKGEGFRLPLVITDTASDSAPK
ncbi:helix-turn-helix transcriptional regulator [Bosea thiooxidans]